MNSQFSGKQSGNIKPRDCRHTPLYGASPNTLSAASLIAHWSGDERGHLWVLSFVIFSFSKIFSENLLTKLTNYAILYPRRCYDHPVLATPKADLLPLIRQGYDMSRSDLYIIRRHRNGSLALSRPCPGCMSLLRANGVRRVFFSVEGGYAVDRL